MTSAPPPFDPLKIPAFEAGPLPPGRESPSEDLVRGYYSGLFQLAQADLGAPETARPAALHTLAAACNNRSALAAGGRLWLYNTALREFRRLPPARPPADAGAPAPATVAIGDDAAIRKLVDRWDAQERRTAVLHYLLHWTTAEIAALLKVSAAAVQTQLELFRQAFASLPAEPGEAPAAPPTRQTPPISPASGAVASAAEARAADYLNRRWPAPALSDEMVRELAGEVDRLCAAQGSPTAFPRSNLLTLAFAAFIVIGLFGALVAWFWTTGLQLGGAFPVATTAATGIPALNQPTPFPTAAPVVPLGSQSTDAEILQRWQATRSFWSSLFIDMQTVDFGPIAYIGPARRYRSQGWVLQPDAGIQLFGLLSQPAGQVNLVGGGQIFTRSYVSGRSASRPWPATVNSLLPDDPLHALVFPAASPWATRQGSFWWVDSKEMLGRRVEVFDWLNHLNQPEARLWLDAATGMILRERVYTGETFEHLRRESVVTEMDFDRHEPPPALIVAAQQSQQQDPAQGSGFLPLQTTPTPAAAATPRPTMPADPPPPGMDPAHSRLVFQFADDPLIADRQVDTAETPAMLFADGYFLGETRFGLPWALRCTRSPDGRRLAFNTGSDGASAPDDGIHWFNLSEPGRVYQPMPGFHADTFAFSPDGRSLAAAGYFDPAPNAAGQDARPRGVYRIDLGTGEEELLAEVSDVRSLVWSPDGKFIALIGRLPGEDEAAILVINADARMVVYQGEPGAISGPPPVDSPIPGWNVPFPVAMGALEECAAPLP